MFVTKAELERRLAVAFLRSIGLPEDIIPLPAGSGPDFTATLTSGTVGLEVTRLYREDSDAGVQHREVEGRWDQVLLGAHRDWSRAGLPPVTVYVRAIPGVVPEKGAVPELVRHLVGFVAARIPPMGGSANFERDWRTWALSPVLPEGVAAIDI